MPCAVWMLTFAPRTAQATSQSRQGGVDGVGRDLGVQGVQRRVDGRFRHHPTALAQELLEKRDFTRRHIDVTARDAHLPRNRIEADIARLQHGPERAAGSAQ